MARKVGQIIARGDRRWLMRVYLGRHHEIKKRNYHNRTIRAAQSCSPSSSRTTSRDLKRS